MRLLWLCLAGLVLVPAAAAEALEVASDPAGDTQAQAAGAAMDAEAPSFGHVDLVGLAVEERKDDVQMTLTLAAMPDHGAFTVHDAQYMIHFRHNDQDFRVLLTMVFGDQVYAWAVLQKHGGENSYSFHRFVPVERDAASSSFRFVLARGDLADRDGAAPFPGRALESFWVESSLRSQGAGLDVNGYDPTRPIDVRDAMPDDGPSAISLVFRQGLQQSGHAALWSDTPLRASNGEASTFVFTLRAENRGGSDDVFDLHTVGVPGTWSAVLPDAAVSIPAGAVVDVPLVLSTPFAHQHGTVQTFQVLLTSRSDPTTVGRAEVGIRYHAVPQPAGHHDEVWFHSIRYGQDNALFTVGDHALAGISGFPFFNTVEDFEADQKVPIRAQYWGVATQDRRSEGPLGTRWAWQVWISPDLEMGLDFDLTRNGTLRLPIATDIAIPQGVLHGEFVHLAFDEDGGAWDVTQVALLEPTAPFDLLAGQQQTFEWPIQVLPDADLLPHRKRAALSFWIYLDVPRPGLFDGAESPKLLPGGYARLPLLEYRDPVPDVYRGSGALHIWVPEVHPVNPASTRLWQAELHNNADHAVAYTLRLGGVHGDWARFLVPVRGTVPAGGTVPIAVAVAVPEDARHGDVVDIAVTATADDDATVQAVGLLRTPIDAQGGHPDDADAAARLESGPVRRSPAGPLWWAPALAVVVWCLRMGRGGVA